MKTGILGGTFNPIHLAHLRIAEEVHQTLELDRTLFIPAAEPPHKDVAGEISFAHRLAMVEAAIKGYPAFLASDLELQRCVDRPADCTEYPPGLQRGQTREVGNDTHVL